MRKHILLISLSVSLCGILAVNAFSDTEGHQFEEAINYMQNEGIVQGYTDGTYQADKKINRAEFTKIIIESLNPTNLDSYTETCFPDIDSEDWYLKYVCYAVEQGIINGYEDGSFKGENNINLIEASKIISLAFKINLSESQNENWYSPYLLSLEKLKSIPTTLTQLDQEITRGEMAEIIWRYKTEEKTKESTHFELIEDEETNEVEIIPETEETEGIVKEDENIEETPEIENSENELRTETCQELGENLPTSVDMDRVRQAWLEWTNEIRVQEGLNPYTINSQLNRTATTWSEVAKNRGYIDHKRDEQTAYYDYGMIQDWFADQGLEFETVSSHQFVENITWSTFTCTAEDCTDTVINHLKQYGFNFFMSEKGSSYAPHYNSIVSPYYREIGMGLAIDPGNKYYFTVHYDTSIISDPLPICE